MFVSFHASFQKRYKTTKVIKYSKTDLNTTNKHGHIYMYKRILPYKGIALKDGMTLKNVKKHEILCTNTNKIFQ